MRIYHPCYVLLILGLLAGCRSEQVAFRFRPVLAPANILAVIPTKPLVPPASRPTTAPARPVALPRPAPVSGELAGPPLRPARRLPGRAHHSEASRRHRVATATPGRAAARPSYVGPADVTVALFLVCLILGGLGLLISPFFSSVTVLLISLGLLAIALLLFLANT